MEVMEAYFKTLAKPNASVTTDAYNIWRTQNKLANTRRDIMNKKRLTDMEIQAIKDKVTDKTDCTENNSLHEGNPSAVAVEDNAPEASDEVAVHNDKEQLNDPNVPETPVPPICEAFS